MYISVELHEMLCDIGLIACGIFFAVVAIAVTLPWIKLLARFVKNELEYFAGIVWIYVRYRRALAQIRRDKRRCKAAMKVFDTPTRWTENTTRRLR